MVYHVYIASKLMIIMKKMSRFVHYDDERVYIDLYLSLAYHYFIGHQTTTNFLHKPNRHTYRHTYSDVNNID